MKWFTPEWANGSSGQSDAQVLRDEAEHRARLSATSSGPVREMADYEPKLDLKDAWIEAVETDGARSKVAIEVIQGDLQRGYGALRLDFGEAEMFEPTRFELAAMLTEPRCEVRYWEIDRSDVDDRYELRCLLWPRGEIGLRFRSSSYVWASLADRGDKPIARVVERSA